MIEFLCPNGHRIRCQAVQVGRAGKCPRCGVKFRIPKEPRWRRRRAGPTRPSRRPEFSDPAVSDKKLPTAAAAPQPTSRRLSSSARTVIVCTGRPIFRASPASVPIAAPAFAFPPMKACRPKKRPPARSAWGGSTAAQDSDIGSPTGAGGPPRNRRSAAPPVRPPFRLPKSRSHRPKAPRRPKRAPCRPPFPRAAWRDRTCRPFSSACGSCGPEMRDQDVSAERRVPCAA